MSIEFFPAPAVTSLSTIKKHISPVMPAAKRLKSRRVTPRRNTQSAKARRLKVGNVRTPGVVRFGKQLLPPRLRNTMKFCGAPVNVALTSAFGKRVFACNGIAVTDLTAAAGQARGFDQLGALYGFFTVYASRIKVEYIKNLSDATENNNQVSFGIFVDDDGGSSANQTTYSQCAEIKTWKAVPSGFPAPNSGGRSTVCYNSWKLSEAFGPNGINNSLYRGTNAANPSIVPTYVVACQDWNSSPGTAITLMVTVEYDVEWDSCILFAAS